MESNHTMSYDVDKSSERMDEILKAAPDLIITVIKTAFLREVI